MSSSPPKLNVESTRAAAAQAMRDAGIVVTAAEEASIELATFGLNDFEKQGLAILVYENNLRYCAKELVMLPRQTCPEHRHPPVRNDPGKMETFRCRRGSVRLYIDGAVTAGAASPPAGSEKYYTVFHEISLGPGDQYTIPPNTRHWFQAGADGAIISEFSSTSRDEADVFTDPNIARLAK